MIRKVFPLIYLLMSIFLAVSCEKREPYPFYGFDEACAHAIKARRRLISYPGVRPGGKGASLTVTVSPAGDVLNVEPRHESQTLAFWPQVQAEIRRWKYKPFEQNGRAVTAQIEEFVEIVPPERLPRTRVAAPILRPDSKVKIRLSRSACFGDCPEYTVTVSTDGILFDGGRSVALPGRHTSKVNPNDVRALAQRFVAADFYSMDSSYRDTVMDSPYSSISITVDGHSKKVIDDRGLYVGMPAVVAELEDEVDALAQTQRWTTGAGDQGIGRCR